MDPTPATHALNTDVDAFCEACRIDRGASPLTLASYRTDLTQFFTYTQKASTPIKSRSTLSSGQITADDVRTWIAHLRDTEHAATSIARKLSALRQFFKFCCLERGLEKNPTDGIDSPTLAARIPRALSTEQIDDLLKAVDRGLAYRAESEAQAARLRIRDRAIVYCLYAAGLRISELTHLTTGDIERGQRYFRVTGKRGKTRIAPYTDTAAAALESYLEQARIEMNPRTEHVFLNSRGTMLTRQSIWKMLKEFALSAGLSSELSPHDLRHSFATHLLQGGMNLRSLQMLLGHADLSSTQIYTHVTPQHLKEAHQTFHPRADMGANPEASVRPPREGHPKKANPKT